MNDDEIFRPSYDPGDFRYAVAEFVRFFIRARLTCDPDFLTVDALQGWDLAHLAQERYSTTQLLSLAADSLGRLNRDFMPFCPSGGMSYLDLSDPVSSLIDILYDFVLPEGGGPEHNGILVKASHRSRVGSPVEWENLANWSRLPDIRAKLDCLPKPQPTIPPASCPPSSGEVPPTTAVGPSNSPPSQNSKHTISADRAESRIRLDDVWYQVPFEVVVWFEKLITSRGGWVSSRDVASSLGVKEFRPDRWIDSVPRPLRLLLEARPGTGTRLKPDRMA